MKTDKEISENLAILGIFSTEQLDKHNLDYWWKKKYTQIFESNLKERNELLINLNTAKENLDQIKYEKIYNYLQKKIIKNRRGQTQYSITSNSSRNKTKKKDIDNQNQKFPFLEYLTLLELNERKILELKFGLNGKEPLSLSEIGDLLGYTKWEVFDIHSEVFKEIEEIKRKWELNDNALDLKNRCKKQERLNELKSLKSNFDSAKKIKNLIKILLYLICLMFFFFLFFL